MAAETLTVVAFALAVVIEVLIFGMLPLATKRTNPVTRAILLSYGNSFSGGIFLGVGFIHLLGGCVADFEYAYLKRQGAVSYPLAMLLSASGFLGVFFVDKVLFRGWGHVHGENDKTNLLEEKVNETTPYGSVEGEISDGAEHAHPFLPYLLVCVLSIHTFFAGIAMGVQSTPDAVIGIYVAIASHKWVEAFALGVSLVKNNLTRKKYFSVIFIFSNVTLLGAAIGLGVTSLVASGTAGIVEGVLTAIASGSFIYVAAMDVLAHEFELHSPGIAFFKYLCCVFGFAISAIVPIFETNN